MRDDAKVHGALRVGGELVVVVVGVLIALWVDNANQMRKDHDQELAYINGILVDLASDSADLVTRQRTAERGLEVADRLLALRRDSTTRASADSLAVWFFRAAFVDNFQVLDHTYREILSAGGLSLLQDDQVRRMISGYYRDIESAEFFTDYYKSEETAYWDLLAERMDPDDFEAVTRSDEVADRLVPGRAIALLRSDPEVANAILMNRHWSALRLGITSRRLDTNRRLAELLRARVGGG